MNFCRNCLYPINSKPTINFNSEGICSGCEYSKDIKTKIDWNQRLTMWEELVEEIKRKRKILGSAHDVLIPVSGGKDSFYQVFTAKKYGLNPLLVSYNHCFNTKAGNANLRKLIKNSGCDHIRYTINLKTAIKLSGIMLEECGDLTWHYHAGIYSLPAQVATKYNISTILWGEQGFQSLVGMLDAHNIVEFTDWSRKEHSMRGISKTRLEELGVTHSDSWLFEYPTKKEIAKLDLRGIYLSSYMPWKPKEQTEEVSIPNGFSPVTFERARTPCLYSKIEDHANEVHDYLKYIKFGYGRGTDDLSHEIRENRISREEAKIICNEYDGKEPLSLDYYCNLIGTSKTRFYEIAFSMQEKEYMDGLKRVNKVEDSESVTYASKIKDYIFSKENSHLYYNKNLPPKKSLDNCFNSLNQEIEVF